MAKKKIEVVEKKVKDLKNDFGNPRKINKNKRDELEKSLETYGDFGLILIDENDNIIAGNQRVSILKEKDEETTVLCKRLVGYNESELRAINIKDNVHNGEWDLELLADWTSDLILDLGIDDDKKEKIDDRKKEGMDPITFEKYNYVVIACNNEIDYNELVRNLGIEGAKVKVAKRTMKARAIWYNDIKAQIVPKDKTGGEK